MENENLVLERSVASLTASDFLALCVGEVLAIRLKEFSPAMVCAQIAERILGSERLLYYPHAPDIARLGSAFYESHDDPAKRAVYYDGAMEATRAFRALSSPYTCPIDQVRLLLEDMWPLGAVRERVHGRPMALGLAQVFKQGTCAWPHQDFLKMDEPDNVRAASLVNQISALVYVRPAIQGGNLELWPEHYDHDAFMARKHPDHYGLDYAKLPAPSVVIQPQIGDLVFMASTKPHAVTHVEQGLRIALNCFIGFRTDSEPLTYWS